MMDTMVGLMKQREEFKKGGGAVPFNKAEEHKIPPTFFNFCDGLLNILGGKVIYAPTKKSVEFDYTDKKGRFRRYKEVDNDCLAAYFSTDNYQLTFYYENNMLELFIIDIPNRGYGLGTRLMNNILDVCDDMKIKIRLIPIAYRSSGTATFFDDCKRLKNYYMTFGFRPNMFSPYLIYSPK